MSNRSRDPIGELQAQSALEFPQRQRAVRDTVESLDLSGGAVLIGTAGLAAWGIDAHVEGPGSFDVDLVADLGTFQRFQGLPGAKSLPTKDPSEAHIPGSATTLPTSALSTPLTPSLALAFGAETFNDISARAIKTNGMLTLPIVYLAGAKSERRETKDFAGIIKAHILADRAEHPITDNEAWQWLVIRASNALLSRVESRRARKAFPDWLGQLATSGFNDPAFTSLNPSRAALRQR